MNGDEARQSLAWSGLLYTRTLTELIDPGRLFDPTTPPLTPTPLQTRSVRAAVKMAARQGYDAGRFTAGTPPILYPELDTPGTTICRRAWLIGFTAGRRVEPRPPLYDMAPIPVEFTAPR
jgi:hypothetical protein